MSKLRQEERDDAVPRDAGYANEADLDASDRALIGEEAADERRDPADREPGSLADDDALYQDVGTQPLGDATAVEPDNDDQETLDGLNPLEEAVREQVEGRSRGDAGDFIP